MSKPIQQPASGEWHVLLDDDTMLTWGHDNWGNVISIVGANTVSDNITADDDVVCFATKADAEVGIEMLAEYVAFLDRVDAIRRMKRTANAA